jgi:diguanylate cyclase (GGDEF)-like protein
LSSPERSRIPLAARWFPLRRRITLTVYLTVLLALAVGLAATAMTQVTRAHFNDLMALEDAFAAVRSYRTGVDSMQFDAHRFVASNHASGADQVTRTYAALRQSLSDCLERRCAGTGSGERLALLLEHLDGFNDAFSEAVEQRLALVDAIDTEFASTLSRVRNLLPDPGALAPDAPGAEALYAIRQHVQSIENATGALLYTADVLPYGDLMAEFDGARSALAQLHDTAPMHFRAELEAALAALEDVQAKLLQRSRAYLFLVNVVMAADAHEMQVLADRLEQQIAQSIEQARDRIEHTLERYSVALILLLLCGSLIVLVTGRIMAHGVTEQIRALTRTFTELTAGSEAPITFRSPHNDEIGELTRAAIRFRDANAEIHDLLRRYQALNESLESKIAERTRALENSNRELERLANTDRLTGVYNRRALSDALDHELARCRRYDRPCSMLFLDVDHFKRINDRYGHEVGDRILVAIACEVSKVLRVNDMFGRWGGEEFLVLNPETGGEGMEYFAERIRRHVAGIDFAPVGHVTLSIGIAQFSCGDTVSTLVERADKALYRAKAEGRNRCVLAPAPAAAPASRKMAEPKNG